MNPPFWVGKRVFLTGHTGFKGSWLSLWLQSLGAEVQGYALEPPTTPNLFEIARVGEGMASTIADIREYSSLANSMAKFQPEIVIHMAAQPLVRLSYDQPIETYSTNVMGTAHVLEAVRQTASARVVVNVTTDKCYENREWVWGYRENEPMGGHDPYSSSKGCAELVTTAYRKSYFQNAGIALASARAGNVIGGGDWASDRLIPDILRAFEQNRPAPIRNPHATRPWQHVLEPLSGYLTLAERLWVEGSSRAEGWNFGPIDGDVQPVQWIVEKMSDLWGTSSSWDAQPGDHPDEASYLKLDISKAQSQLDWKPQWRLDTTLGKIVHWHKAWLAGSDMQAETLRQISLYSNALSGINHEDA